jgi:hypothetical protein
MISINIKNFLIITLIAILGIVMMKVIFTKYQITGLSEVVQSV